MESITRCVIRTGMLIIIAALSFVVWLILHITYCIFRCNGVLVIEGKLNERLEKILVLYIHHSVCDILDYRIKKYSKRRV